jgi:hypothetical protein
MIIGKAIVAKPPSPRRPKMIKFNVKKAALAAATILALAAPVAASAQQIYVHVGAGRAYDPYYGGYVVYDHYGRWVDDYGNYHYRDGRWYDRGGRWHDHDDWGWRDGRGWRDHDRGWHHGWGDHDRGDRGDWGDHDRGWHRGW